MVALLVLTAAPALAAESSGTAPSATAPGGGAGTTTSTTTAPPTASAPAPAPPSTTAPAPTTTTPAPAAPAPGPEASAPSSTGPAATDPATGPAWGEGTPSAGAGADPGPVDGFAPAVGYLTGPDVSSWNHPNGQAINWNQVAAAGHSFAFVKATEGPYNAAGDWYTNPWFQTDFAGAGAAGLYRAPYHFARPMLPISTAIDQARYMIDVTGPLGGPRDLPAVLDIEVTGGLDATDLRNWTLTFVQEVERLTKRPPIIYTGPNFWRTYLANTSALSRYPLWMASWTTASSPGSTFGGWSSWTFWQHTDSGTSPGIGGRIDLNRFCCGLGGLAELAGHPTRSFVRHATTTGVADRVTDLHTPPGGRALACDTDGDGLTTTAVFDHGRWYVSDAEAGGRPEKIFGYGQLFDTPVCGDWDGNGSETPGIVRNGVWYLTNTTGNPFADVVLLYGDPWDRPVVGDWNGDGRDTPGIVRGGVWYLTDNLGSGVAQRVLGYGDPWDVPVAGDWNGDGRSTPGVFRHGQWFLVDSLAKPTADRIFGLGGPGDNPIVGRWRSGATASAGVTRQL